MHVLPNRHKMNLAALVVSFLLLIVFVRTDSVGLQVLALLIMTAIALVFGWHLVASIGGADMPVVVSMLNSYSGWAAAAAGFMLSNDLLIVTGGVYKVQPGGVGGRCGVCGVGVAVEQIALLRVVSAPTALLLAMIRKWASTAKSPQKRQRNC